MEILTFVLALVAIAIAATALGLAVYGMTSHQE